MSIQSEKPETQTEATTVEQSELIRPLEARVQIAHIANWLNMRCGIEYDVATTLTILERKIKTMRQRLMLTERLAGRDGYHSADCDLMAGQDIL